MARVALGGSLRNSGHVRKGAAWYAHNLFCPVGSSLLFAPPPSSLKLSTSLPPAKLIADSVKRSSRANLFHFYSPLCEIASVLHKAPSACISVDRLAVLSGVPAEKERKEMESAAIGRTHHASSSRRGPGHLVSFDARELVRKRLKEVRHELGVPRGS
jgi:hypothetical protein